MTHEKLKAAFLQGGEHEASEVFNELIRGSVREAFWQMMAQEVEVLCGPRYRPDTTNHNDQTNHHLVLTISGTSPSRTAFDGR